MTITLPPKLPDDDRPCDYAGLYAEFRKLEEVISDLLFRLGQQVPLGTVRVRSR